MRGLFFLFSVVTHATFFILALAGSSRYAMPTADMILQAELVTLSPQPQKPPAPLPEPEPVTTPDPAESSATAAPQDPAIPQTDAAPESPKPSARPEAAAPDIPPEAPVVAPGVKPLSTRAEAEAPRPVVTPTGQRPQGRENAELVLRQGYRLRLDDGTQVTLKRGAEFRSLRMMAVRNYTIDEYVGHYRVDDERFVSIIDARDSHGTMILHDPRNGLLRRLKKFGNMIYTYGPSYDEDAPVEGTITFLTSKEHTETVKAPSRILWDPAKPPALLGTKIYFRERRIELDAAGQQLRAELVAPLGDGPYPGIILINGDSCAPPRLFRGMARQLALQGMAVMVPEVRGCSATEAPAPTVGQLVQDAHLWRSVFAKMSFVEDTKTGYWGRDNGSAIALMAAVKTAEQPSFVFCSTAQRPDVKRVAPLPEQAMRQFSGQIVWLFTGPRPRQYWSAFAAALQDRTGNATTVNYLQTALMGEDTALWLREAGPACVDSILSLVETGKD